MKSNNGFRPNQGFKRTRQSEKIHKSSMWSTLVLYRISCIASGLALLEDEQKFKLGDVLALIKH
jgi:hypothetical protein